MLNRTSITARNNVTVTGEGAKTLVLAHGFGCDQRVWQYVVPTLSKRYTLVLFDYVGSGRSQLSAFSQARYATLEGYAQDVVEICKTLDLRDVHFVGHSVSATIGQLAALEIPERIASQIMICPSPCFLNVGPEYQGGFERADLEELIELMDRNYIGWAHYLAPLVMGPESSEQLIGELSESFCSTDPVVAKVFAKATFFADYRHLLPRVTPPALLLQSQVDSLASPAVGRYMHARMPQSTLRELPCVGHCTHMTHPETVIREIDAWLGQSS
ncbi:MULTISPECIES: alpha/beta fold hydrolase [unclassified Halomonas]|uniref:alpha/beta fold hydrolase n=1 Tax=unclassified Halomonas TaxID=2609666 RepID=UPI0021E48539|nr:MULTISPECIES: alpha/beta hydrolase [unclassified Halomonas]UYF99659.1 alpha/beta hydrolase [Halomonas sp. GD1P12]WNL39250.1 alpha/beta hydrolase [Halomonas sp. PAMB 3232]